MTNIEARSLKDAVTRRYRRASLALRQTNRPPGRDARPPEGPAPAQSLINDTKPCTVAH